jgi:hypothetical protein
MLRKPTDQPDTDPQLRSLANNGGPTKTMAIGPNSPAVDQGLSAVFTADQRGARRPVIYPNAKPLPPGGDGSDIGAFELQPPSGGSSPKIVAGVRPGSADTGVRTCFRFKAQRKSGGRIAGATVKLAGKKAVTDDEGKAQICKKFKRSGVRKAKIAKAGFTKAKLPIQVR